LVALRRATDFAFCAIDVASRRGLWGEENMFGDGAMADGEARSDPASAVAKKRVFGIDFSAIALEKTLEMIVQRPLTAPFTYIVTPNVDHVVWLHAEHRDVMPFYQAAWLRLCDSRVLKLLAWLRGINLPVVTGSDVVAQLFAQFITPQDTLTIIGCTEATIAKLRALYGLEKVAHYNPPMNFIASLAEIETCIAFVKAHPARYIFMAVGSPQGEILAAKIAASGRAVGIGLCSGASLNFLTGVEQRAPRWMQHCGLEWMFRLLRDPRRLWRRYLLRCPRIFAMLLRSEKALSSVA
jgi:N-acetylglucosaminyldiphosphoundecaprenol N-acetyl-beta-D-mannosaminyltransferase